MADFLADYSSDFLKFKSKEKDYIFSDGSLVTFFLLDAESTVVTANDIPSYINPSHPLYITENTAAYPIEIKSKYKKNIKFDYLDILNKIMEQLQINLKIVIQADSDIIGLKEAVIFLLDFLNHVGIQIKKKIDVEEDAIKINNHLFFQSKFVE